MATAHTRGNVYVVEVGAETRGREAEVIWVGRGRGAKILTEAAMELMVGVAMEVMVGVGVAAVTAMEVHGMGVAGAPILPVSLARADHQLGHCAR